MQSRQNILRLKVFTSKYSFKISVEFVSFLDIDNIPVLEIKVLWGGLKNN